MMSSPPQQPNDPSFMPPQQVPSTQTPNVGGVSHSSFASTAASTLSATAELTDNTGTKNPVGTPHGLTRFKGPQAPASNGTIPGIAPILPLDPEMLRDSMVRELEAAKEENRNFYINSAKKMIQMQEKIDELTRENVKLIKSITPQTLSW